jgi:hypothetical protein
MTPPSLYFGRCRDAPGTHDEGGDMRLKAALVLGPLLVLGVAGCGSGGGNGVATAGDPSATARSTAAEKSEREAALEFTRCMRSSGVPDFPDPKFGDDGEMQLSVPEGADKSKVAAAQDKCEKYLPSGGEPEPVSPDVLEKMRDYAKCMRENGVPKFPDPDPNGGFQIQGGPGLDPQSSEFKAADEKCRAHLPGGGSLNDENGGNG